MNDSTNAILLSKTLHEALTVFDPFTPMRFPSILGFLFLASTGLFAESATPSYDVVVYSASVQDQLPASPRRARGPGPC